MAGETHTFDSELWRHDGPAAWYFVSLPSEVADEVEAVAGATAGGFGSVRVDVTIGATRWSTSLFPDGKRATYVLPVKKAVRVAEGLGDGSPVRVTVVLAS